MRKTQGVRFFDGERFGSATVAGGLVVAITGVMSALQTLYFMSSQQPGTTIARRWEYARRRVDYGQWALNAGVFGIGVLGIGYGSQLLRDRKWQARLDLLARIAATSGELGPHDAAEIVALEARDLLRADCAVYLNAGGANFNALYRPNREQYEAAISFDDRLQRKLLTIDAVRSQSESGRRAINVPLRHNGALVGVVRSVGRRRVRSAARLSYFNSAAGALIGRSQLLAALEQEAATDPLTGLPNRRSFERSLRAMEVGATLVVLDLDRFKSINEEYGYQRGDDVIASMGECLQKLCDEERPSRVGGEEFAVIVPPHPDRPVRKFMSELRDVWCRMPPLTTFSAGVAVHAGVDPSDTFRHADIALHRAKKLGRDRVEYDRDPNRDKHRPADRE